MITPNDILGSTSFGAGLSDATRRALLGRGRAICIAGGRALFVAGSPPDAVYLVMSGRLIIVREAAEDGGDDSVIGYVRAGEIVGEMSMLDGGPRTASAYALRDTELIALDAGVVRRLMAKRADFAASVARTILRRSRAPKGDSVKAPPRVFAVVAPSPSVDAAYIARDLSTRIKFLQKKAKVLPEPESATATAEVEVSMHGEEEAVDVLFLPCRIGDSDWYRFCMRHADRILVCARRDARPPTPLPLTTDEASPARRFRLVDLVAIHEGQGPGWTRDWVRETDADRVFHWGDEASKDRLARAIAGRSLGLCLSGGGARAYAQFGVIKELRRRGAPLDFVGGASMGAVIAACVAMGWGLDEIDARLRDAFVDTNPLSDHILPVIALTRGARVDERLKRHFGEKLIEDLELPFFCVSSELTRGVVRVHRRGVLREALRASISLPGLLPPVVDGDQLLVDGAVLNNFPVDVMRTRHRGLTIGVDVAREGTIAAEAFVNPPSFVNWVREHGLSAAPPIVSLLMRAATAGRPFALGSEAPDILVTPDAPGVDLRDWKKFDLAVDDGLIAARTAFDAASWALQPYCREAPEVRASEVGLAAHG
ncbi:MAG: cyclic nucleotide-binding domain-containing protein [Alphaproteobacteria bacterium]|nr:cyclic nucleotide-binding domain-containing protein [Alphaproteobacteria bacterium]